ncbi:MAG: RsmG family class I SAM-dependent methyltransferase [Candidatus Fermentibacteraceae bacterium]
MDRRLPVVDIGSGSGLPGIPLALMGYDVVLLEPRRKRYLFLTHAVEVLGVPARAERARLEDWISDAPGSCQFVCRAVRPPGGMLELLEGYAGSGGTLTMRLPPGEAIDGAANASELVVPPLDRRGLLVQFRLPEASRRT